MEAEIEVEVCDVCDGAVELKYFHGRGEIDEEDIALCHCTNKPHDPFDVEIDNN